MNELFTLLILLLLFHMNYILLLLYIVLDLCSSSQLKTDRWPRRSEAKRR